MRQATTHLKNLLLTLCLIATTVSYSQTTVISKASTWNYIDDGTDKGTTWVDSGYNDGTWSSGAGPLGMGGIDGATIATTITKQITTYYRQEVTLSGMTFGELTLNLLCDDGAVVYINGKEAYRFNLPTGTITYTTTATTAIGGGDEGDYDPVTINDTFLINGVNTIAVELHNQSSTSSDLGFDLEIISFNWDNYQIGKNGSWNYLDDGSDQGTSWVDSGFNDASWSSGNAVLGMGSIDDQTIATTIVKNITTYFRKEVTINNDSFTHLEIGLLCDDGAVVYINGTEVMRDNMPTGAITYTTTASSATGSEGDYEIFTFLDNYFIDGVNTIAVELHNSSAGSSDLGFDLHLKGIDLGDFEVYVGEEWKYLDDGSNQGTSWVDSGFDHSSWDSGAAVLGYGDLDGNTVSTTVSYGSDANDKHRTTYFRKEINLDNPDYDFLEIQLLADDGAVVYINGKQAIKYGMPDTWDYVTFADITVSAGNEGDYTLYSFPDTFLVDGINTIAVEIHQVNATSSDLGFDLSLKGLNGKIISGQVYLDLNGDGLRSVEDTRGSGAVEIEFYNDLDSNGTLEVSEYLHSELSVAHGYYSSFIVSEVTHLGIKLLNEDFDVDAEFTTDTILSYKMDTVSTDTLIADFGQLGPNSLCLLIADDQENLDEYYLSNRITGKQKLIGEMATDEIEALAIRIGMDSIWAFDDGQFGSVDLVTGEFTTIGSGVGYGTGIIGGSSAGHTFSDIDGLAYDPINDLLFGVERRPSGNDLLTVINRKTGGLMNGHFGSGREFLEIAGTGIKQDVDDIAFDPATGLLLAVNNQNSGDSTRYISIDPATGVGTVLSVAGVGDFEGLGYYNTGELYGTTGVEAKPGYPANSIFRIDKSTGLGTLLAEMDDAIDVEACDCLTGPTENLIYGVVFYDNDSSGTYNRNIDTAYGDIKVYLYRDANENGIIDSMDYIIDSTLTNVNRGLYVFETDSLGSFLTSPVIFGTPFYTMNTTTDDSLTEDAHFDIHGDFDGRNNFGFHITAGAPYLPVEFLDINAKWNNAHDADVTWKAASEINASHFVVERSTDARSFTPVGTVSASGNSNEIMDYAFTDVTAHKVTKDMLYYRIKEVDFDGKSHYSDVACLKRTKEISVKAYPNPVEDYVSINYDAQGEYALAITDIAGNTVIELTGIKPNEQTPIRVDGLNRLTAGIYFVHVRRNGIDTVAKILK